MAQLLGNFSILAFALIAGIRHGFDLDHIAAISDITSSQKSAYLGLFYSGLYASGHGIVVIILGILLLAIGQNIPQGLDLIFGKFIGITLIGLGIYVLYSIWRHGRNFKYKSKWMLMFDAISFGYHKLLHRFEFTHRHSKVASEKYGTMSVTGIGMIHGLGAETPTQVSVLLALSGIGGGQFAIYFLLLFVIGIFLSNILVAFFSAFGFMQIKSHRRIYLISGIITAIFSIFLGFNFLGS